MFVDLVGYFYPWIYIYITDIDWFCTGVLDEEGGDTLINVNLVDEEKAEKNLELKKKKPDYNPYDAGDVDEYGMVRKTFFKNMFLSYTCISLLNFKFITREWFSKQLIC